jgi:DNA polymerase-3 subunit beta
MRFTVSRDSLLVPLQLLSGVIERRQTLPILSNILLAADDGELVLTATDQEVELTIRVADIEIDEPGETTVPGRKLVDIIKSLPEGAGVVMALDGSRLGVRAARFRSHLATLPVTDFPVVETGQGETVLSLSKDLLSRLLARTSFAMAQQDVRYFFNGILVEIGDEMVRLVATNGQRLATSTGDVPDVAEKGRFIVPRKGVSELARVLADVTDEDIELRFSGSHLRVAAGHATLTTKLIDGTYPDYTRAIPGVNDKAMVGDRLLIREALNRTAILSNEMYRNVRLTLKDSTLSIHANNPLQEEAEESVSVEYEGDPLEIGFNVSYLLDALAAMQGGNVKIEFSSANGASVLTDPEDTRSLYVVSPMML